MVPCRWTISSEDSVAQEINHHTEYQWSRAITYTQQVATDASASIVGGDGTLVLLKVGFMQFSETRVVQQDPAVNSVRQCSVQVKPSMAWSDVSSDGAASLLWISVGQIKAWEEKQADFESEITKLQLQIDSNSTQRPPNFKPALWGNFSERLDEARDGWSTVLRYVQMSKDRAVKFDPAKHRFKKAVHDAVLARPSSNSLIKGTIPGMASHVGNRDSEFDGDNPARPLSSVQEQTDAEYTKVGVDGIAVDIHPSVDSNGLFVSFVGGGSKQSFTLQSEAGSVGLDQQDGLFTSDDSLTLGVQIKSGFGLLVGKSLSATVGYQSIETGQLNKKGDQKSTQSVSFTLGDPEPGDIFDVEVRIDELYGTPVFVTRGGQSRCPSEANTLPRETIRAQLGFSRLSMVPPNSIARVPLILDNQSPTREQFSYKLAMASRSGLSVNNAEGLHVSVAGVPLATGLLSWAIPYGGPADPNNPLGLVQSKTDFGLFPLTLEVSRVPGSPYTYKNVELSIGASGTCAADKFNKAAVSFSIFFQPECSRIQYVAH